MDQHGRPTNNRRPAAGRGGGDEDGAPAVGGSRGPESDGRGISVGQDPQAQTVAERRQLGAAYLHAYVEGDEVALGRLHEHHKATVLLAGLATAARAMVIHVADRERASPLVVTAAYRDVWS